MCLCIDKRCTYLSGYGSIQEKGSHLGVSTVMAMDQPPSRDGDLAAATTLSIASHPSLSLSTFLLCGTVIPFALHIGHSSLSGVFSILVKEGSFCECAAASIVLWSSSFRNQPHPEKRAKVDGSWSGVRTPKRQYVCSAILSTALSLT